MSCTCVSHAEDSPPVPNKPLDGWPVPLELAKSPKAHFPRHYQILMLSVSTRLLQLGNPRVKKSEQLCCFESNITGDEECELCFGKCVSLTACEYICLLEDREVL